MGSETTPTKGMIQCHACHRWVWSTVVWYDDNCVLQHYCSVECRSRKSTLRLVR
jgi:hypothetical protein